MRSALGPLVAILLVACRPTASPATEVAITVVAGPVCPVETVPADPACAPRPVAGAEILVRGADGRTVASLRTDASGQATVALVPGSYSLHPQPVGGLAGAAPEAQLEVGATPVTMTVTYDTGIR